MRKKMYWKRAAAIGTAVVLGCGMTACGSDTATDTEKSDKETDEEDSDELLATMNSVTGMNNSGGEDSQKEETVYVMADQSGDPTEIIVSEWLKNPDGSKTLKDSSNLNDIENVKGNENYKKTSGGIEWEANGSDIYYEGTSDKELPVQVKVTYYLDDKEMNPKDMLGKSGKVRIRYDYINKSTSAAEIGGTNADIYTPFVMATGMFLPTDTFKNVKVSNGNVISEGNNMIAVGVGMPGLADSIGLDQLSQLDFDLELPEYFEITADAQDFNLGMSLTLCSNNLIDLSEFFSDNGMDGITSDIDQLIDGAGQLKDGSAQLADGTGTLDSKLVEFGSGISELVNGFTQYTDGVSGVKTGAKSLADGSDTLDAGVKTLADGAKTAKSGSSQLTEGAGTLNSGAKDLTEGAGTLNSGAQSIAEGAQKLDAGAQSLLEGIQQADAGAKSVGDGATSLKNGTSQIIAGYEGENGAVAGAAALAGGLNQLNEAVQGLALPDVSSQSSSLTEEQKAAVEAQIQAYLSQGAGKEAIDANTASFIQNVEALMAQSGAALDDQTKAVLEAVVDGTFRKAFENIYISAYESGMEMGMEQVLGQVSAQLESFGPQISVLKDSVGQLNQGAAGLSAGVNALYEGTKSVDAGLNDLANGTAALSAGTGQLSAGAAELKSGTSGLYSGSQALYSGSQSLYSGSQALYGGSQTLYTGIQTLDAGLLQILDGSGSLKAGTAALRSGAHTLADGAATLDASSSKLTSGISQIQTATGQVQDGVKELNAGAVKLKDGIWKFNEEGVDKIKGIIKEDLNHITDRLEAVSESNDNYELYGGIAQECKGTEKFIIKIDGIEK